MAKQHKTWLLLSVLLLLLSLSIAADPPYKIIPDTDLIGQNLGYGPGKSATDCAEQCMAKDNCVGISWNAPASRIHDGNCNFKCFVDKYVKDVGEQAIMVRNKTANLCQIPPPPPPPYEPCPADMPSDWLPACLNGDLFYSKDASGGLLPELANGYIGTIAMSDTIYAGGLFNGDAIGKFGPASHRAVIPAIHNKLGNMMTTSRALNIRKATFEIMGTIDFVSVHETYYAHSTRPSVLVHEIELTNSGSSDVTVPITTTQPGQSKDLNLTSASKPPSNTISMTGTNMVPEDAQSATGSGNYTMISLVGDVACVPALASCVVNVTIPKASKIQLQYLTVIVTSLNSTNPDKDVLDLYADAKKSTSLAAEHADAWAKRWARGSIEIQGDLPLAQAVNASLYTLRASIRDDFPYGLSPGGLTTDGYNGHTFWDQETWMWPPLLFLDPPSAQSALEYRFNRRAGAAHKAATCGQPNSAYCPPGQPQPADALEFPWESAVTGYEVQYSGGKIGPWGEFEQHISGDISFAARQYFLATQDLVWLRNVGWPLISGVASFYANRVSANADGTYSYNMVMGPDEYAYPVNNSATTNAVAIQAIKAAMSFAPLVNKTVPTSYAQIAKGLVIREAPYPNGEGMYHPEYEGYPKIKGAKVKQADTVMLSYPYGVNMDPTVLANDLTWYEPNTDPNGPAMTFAIFAIGWFNTGNYTHAQARFQRGFSQNVRPPFYVWQETLHGGCTPFLTGAGGFLQSLVFGTSGMRLNVGQLDFNPPPPSATGSNATKISLKGFNYLGFKINQDVTETTVSYTIVKAPSDAMDSQCLKLIANGGTQILSGKAVSIPRAPHHILLSSDC
eukprot:m.51219 g.51219  ORF g.51219 m.51219 type:complete len:846 (+) comp10717_c0_seq2:16-2553(+)